MQLTIATLLTILTAVSAAPSAYAPPTPPSYQQPAPPKPTSYGMMVLRSASPIHYGQVNASGGKFYIGLEKPSVGTCPGSVPKNTCPAGKNTLVLFNDNKYASLNVMVPGGQRIYVAPDRSLSYTSAHSAYIPTGSKVDGFKLGKKGENTLRPITHTNGPFVACPKKKGTGPWKVYVGTPKPKDAPSGCATDCLEFSNMAVEVTNERYGAWQYN